MLMWQNFILAFCISNLNDCAPQPRRVLKKMQINLNNFDVISIWCLHDRIDTFCCCSRQLVDGAFCLVLSQLLSLHSEEFNVNKLKFLRMLVLAIIDLKPTMI